MNNFHMGSRTQFINNYLVMLFIILISSLSFSYEVNAQESSMGESGSTFQSAPQNENYNTSSQIMLQTNNAEDNISVLFTSALEQFNKGNIKAAKRIYAKILKNRRENINARFGLASIALSENKIGTAITLYQQIISLHPRHPTAILASMTMRRSGNHQHTIDRINEQIIGHFDKPFMFYMLGVAYAKNGNWERAYRSFWDAFTRQNTIAEYAYNLAISAERIGSLIEAERYYKKALSLSENRKVMFDRELVRRRLINEFSVISRRNSEDPEG